MKPLQVFGSWAGPMPRIWQNAPIAHASRARFGRVIRRRRNRVPSTVASVAELRLAGARVGDAGDASDFGPSSAPSIASTARPAHMWAQGVARSAPVCPRSNACSYFMCCLDYSLQWGQSLTSDGRAETAVPPAPPAPARPVQLLRLFAALHKTR